MWCIISKPMLNSKLKCKLHRMEVQARKNRFRVSRDMNEYPIRGALLILLFKVFFYFVVVVAVLLYFVCFLATRFAKLAIRFSHSLVNGDGCMRYEYEAIEMRFDLQILVGCALFSHCSPAPRIYISRQNLFASVWLFTDSMHPIVCNRVHKHLVCILTQTILCILHSTLQSGHIALLSLSSATSCLLARSSHSNVNKNPLQHEENVLCNAVELHEIGKFVCRYKNSALVFKIIR